MSLKNNTLLQGGKYKIIRFINSGGFGCTYEAEHVMLHKRVAIKEFFVKDFCNRNGKTGFVTVGTESKTALVTRLKEKFIDEAVALSQMNHPNIVKVMDVFEENGTAYYVMDYIEGHSLDEIVKMHGALSESATLGFIGKIANALEYIHKLNRLHLDIKPGNIMINIAGQAILIDFGVSKQYDSVDGENTSTLMGKTPGYAPIEQMGNSVQKFTPATDIYALGATLYKLVTGITPLEATEIIDNGLPEIKASISEATKHAIRKAMECRRKDRPQTIKEFTALLPVPDSIDKGHTQEHAENENTEYAADTDETVFDNMRNCNNAVDLGLSVKWANMNFGAQKPWEHGDLIGWGDITGKEESQILEFYPNSNPPDTLSGNEVYDIVTKIWGKPWRMPTKKEQDELRMKCKCTVTSENGVAGCIFTADNGNSIFLPFAGMRTGDITECEGEAGYYWSGTLHRYNKETAYYLLLSDSTADWRNTRRYFGMAIRPVCDDKNEEN